MFHNLQMLPRDEPLDEQVIEDPADQVQYFCCTLKELNHRGPCVNKIFLGKNWIFPQLPVEVEENEEEEVIHY